MENALSYVLVENIFVFILIFARFGAALTIMPGFGDFFVPVRVRLFLALTMSFFLTAVFFNRFPEMPQSTVQLVGAIFFEFVVGALIGAMARILISALDTAGMLIGITTGLANAQIFNPGAQTQGSLIGTFFYLFGVALIFATNMHHVMIYAVYESYQMMPPMSMPAFDNISELVTRAVSHSFLIGVKLSIPFLVIGLILYTAMGVMGRLMPQLQIFILALPLQVYLGFLTLSLALSAIMVYWLTHFEEGMIFFLGS